MARIYDLSVPVREGMPSWPGGPGFRLTTYKRIASGEGCNNSRISTDLHIGTHLDAPWHFVDDGVTVERLPLDLFLGPAAVRHLLQVDSITAAHLEALALPADTRRLLLRTRNSDLWLRNVREFRTDFVALTADAARWVVDHGIRLLGVDYLSVQRFHDGPATHQILLGAGVVAVEGLNLSQVPEGVYELICLPLALAGADGSPCRAVLRELLPAPLAQAAGTDASKRQ